MSDAPQGRDTSGRRIRSGDPEVSTATGPIAYMAKNGVAANLLLAFLVAAGIFSIGSLVQEVFPEFSLDTIQVSVAYPGANPDEVEESIVQKIEEQIEAVEGVDEINATAGEGVGIVTVSLKLGTDLSRALDDIKAEVDQIQTFPVGAERPEVRELTNRQSVIRLAVFGDTDERTIKEIAYRTEDILSSLDEVSYVETSGIRPYEISIEIPEDRLRALGITLGEIAGLVRRSSLDLSAGSIETADEQVRVRTLGQNYTQQDFEEIVVLSRGDGTVVRLRDIGAVVDGFQDTDLITRYNGQPAAFVEVFRTSDEKVLEIVAAVQVALDEEVLPSVPAGVRVEIWENSATVLQGRLGLLIKNGIIGLSLVLIALTLFLDIRLAFWTAIGIGVSFIGTFAIMLLLGVSINVLSLFGFILAIGIVVDDAIVVGENIFAEREGGAPPQQAAIQGALRIRGPVTFAVLTTIVAFTPLMLVPGTFGKILVSIPIIVISVLALSLVESLFILPNHLSHLPPPHHSGKNPVTRFFERVQMRVDQQLKRFVEGPLDRAITFAVRRPSIVISGGIALIIMAIGMVPAGILTVQFFPAVEADVVSATLEMEEGTTADRTFAVAERIRVAGERAGERLTEGRDPELPPLVEGVYLSVGQAPRGGGPDANSGVSRNQPSVAGIQFKLLEAEQRDVSSARFEELWREEVGEVVGARSLTFASSIIGGGPDIQLEISFPEADRLERIGDQVLEELATFEGVYDLQSDQSTGLREVQLRLLPQGRTLGLTLDDVARQVRAAFFGEEALRVQRGREDVRVYLRLPESERDAIADVERYRVRTPAGGEVPLAQIATVGFGTSPTSIQRRDGRRVLTLTARVNREVTSPDDITAALTDQILPPIRTQNPQMSYQFGGDQEQQGEASGAIFSGLLLALLIIYTLLAIPFGSYVQPLIIMAAVPFGIVGALLGHLLLDIPVGLLSLFGIIGLSGVVVNDSLVMIDFVNENRRKGMGDEDAIREGAKSRFRPIFLTSLTTFLGVAPITFERSLQAQFLIPMAAALAFGIIFATVILMLVVPALASVQFRVQVMIIGDQEDELGAPVLAGGAD